MVVLWTCFGAIRCGAVGPRGIRVDGGHAQGRTYVAGNEKENDGANGAAAGAATAA